MYKVDYELLTYEKLQNRLQNILNNESNKHKVIKCEDLGKSPCGFPIEHYKIGNGPIHLTYMGGAHGNEIISVDYVTQLMNNIALGNTEFDESMYTIDFIPVENPEGFAVTTYAIDSVTKNMSEEEFEKFSKDYYLAFRNDDIKVASVNKKLRLFLETFNIEDSELITRFWIDFNKKDIKGEALFGYLASKYNVDHIKLIDFINENFESTITSDREHTKIFDNLSVDCIPELSDSHKLLKEKITKMYASGNFEIGTLANFYANSDGVNLNDNNPNYYKIMNDKTERFGVVMGNARDNHIIKNINGPIGTANYDMSKPFEYSSENQAIFNYIESQNEREENFAFFNCHGTGGLLYIYPVFDKEKETGVRDFSFYINNRISTEYTNATGATYEEKTGKFDPYKTSGYPEEITGVGDILRKNYIASFILELSKMGGNPLAPYGDRANNYTLTMEANFNAFNKTLSTILSLQDLYSTTYNMTYDSSGQVHYEIGNKSR